MSYRTGGDEELVTVVVEKTEKQETKTAEITAEDALRAWIAMGLELDRKCGGQLNVVTAGYLGALREHYLAHRAAREGN